MQIVGQTWINLVTWTCGSWNEGQHDIFHGSMILSYILKTIWCMYIILSEYESVWPEVWPQNKCRSLWLIYHGPLIVPYTLKTISCMNIIIRESIWPDAWPKTYRSLWHDSTLDLKHIGRFDLYFMVQWFSVISWKLFDVWTLSLGIMGQYDRIFDFKMNICHSDLYLMGHWSCLISQILFYRWMSYFQILRQCDPNFDIKINICQHDQYFKV